MMMPEKKILISGAAGFIGSFLVKELQKENYVYALVNKGQAVEENINCKKIEIDLNSFEDYSPLPDQLDAIIHLAQANGSLPGDEGLMFNVNTLSTKRLLDYGKQAGISQFLLASSGSIYGQGSTPFRETDPPDHADFYSFTKYSSELLTRACRDVFPTIILRIFTPYGPGQENRLIPNLVKRIISGEKITLVNNGHPRLNPIFISDMVEVIKRSLLVKENIILNVGGKKNYSIRDISEIIGQIYMKKVTYEYLSDQTKKDLMGDIGQMERVLRYSPQVDLPDGILKMRNM